MNQINSNEYKFIIERLLYQITQKMDHYIRQFYEPFGLTAPQAMILLYLHRNKQGKITEVAHHLRMTNSNLSTICRRLERDGYITRTRDIQDQRIVWISLTEKCKAQLTEIEDHLNSQYLNELGTLSQKDMDDILNGLVKLETILTKANL